MAGAPYVTLDTLDQRTAAWVAAVEPWSRRRPLPPLRGAALLVLDLQRYFAALSSHAYLPALKAILPRVIALVAAFRAVGRPVVLTQHGSLPDAPEGMMQRWWRDDLRQGEARARLVPELEALGPPDLLLSKSRYSAFEGTDLAGWLQERGCDTVVICGVMTHLCCESTARAAFMQDLAPVVLADGCASLDEELHLGALRGLAHGFAVISTTAEVSAALAPAQPAATQRCSTPAKELPRSVELAIVGAGPAGLGAAIQARRSGVDLLLLDEGKLGGQAAAAERIENYPGFPGGINGAQLVERFSAQADLWSLQPSPWRVEAVEQGGAGELELRLVGRQKPLAARAVIVATGCAPRGLTIPGADELSTPLPVVPTADLLPSVRGQRILVIGGGEAALDQALLARRRGAAAVTVALRGAAPRAMALLVQRARDAGIELRCGATLARLESAQGNSAILTLAGAEPDARLPVDAIVVCIGKIVRLPELPGEALGPDGAPLTDTLGRTPVEGLYLAGDVRRGPYRQVAIAAGDGVAAAMHAVHYLRAGAWRS